MRTPKMHFCFYCGAELGVYAASAYESQHDTCGKPECEREVRDALRAERDEAHKQLDRDMGWDY